MIARRHTRRETYVSRTACRGDRLGGIVFYVGKVWYGMNYTHLSDRVLTGQWKETEARDSLAEDTACQASSSKGDRTEYVP